jgi:hypothetical protein
MPPKRKALAEAGDIANVVHTAKVRKTSSELKGNNASSAAKAPSGKPQAQTYKYCNANTVSSPYMMFRSPSHCS